MSGGFFKKPHKFIFKLIREKKSSRAVKIFFKEDQWEKTHSTKYETVQKLLK